MKDGSVVFNISFITCSIYDRYESCSRADIHGAKIFPGLINVNFFRLDIIDKH